MRTKLAWGSSVLALGAFACDRKPSPVPLAPAALLAGRPLAGPVRIAVFDEASDTPVPFAVDRTQLVVDAVAPRRIVGIDVADGWLIGTNHGEWRGGVWWFSADGKRKSKMVADNCVALVNDGTLALCLTGLGHLSSAHGAIHAFEHRDARWVYLSTTPLPGCPQEVELRADGVSLTMTCHLGYANTRACIGSEHVDALPWRAIRVSYEAGRVTY